MLLGATTKCFGGMTVQAVAELFAKSGLSCAELCLCQQGLEGWRYNLCGTVTLSSPETVCEAVGVFRSFGVEVSAIGVYSCFWSGGEKGLFQSLSHFYEYCDIACACGVKRLATHGGISLRPEKAEMSDRSRSLLLDGFSNACIEAEKRGLTVSVEASGADVLDGYNGYCQLREYVLDYIGRSSMLGYTACPAADGAALKISAQEISMYHLKDVARDGRFFERFGDGCGDYSSFFADVLPDAPVILEFVNSGNLAETAERVYSAAM